jgi:hypothetical protein
MLLIEEPANVPVLQIKEVVMYYLIKTGNDIQQGLELTKISFKASNPCP